MTNETRQSYRISITNSITIVYFHYRECNTFIAQLRHMPRSSTIPNPNGLFGIAAMMLDYNNNRATKITASSHYDYYQLTTHNSRDKNN